LGKTITMSISQRTSDMGSNGDVGAVNRLRKRRRSHAQRREEAEQRMIDAAVRIVAERGLDDLTLAECGEAAGYSRGLAAHYFGSKNELIAAIANHIVADYVQRLRSGSRGKKGFEGFLEGVEFYIDSGRSRPLQSQAFHAVLGAGPVYPQLADTVSRLNRESVDAFARGLTACKKRGTVRSDIDTRAQATLILSMLRGVMAQWLLDPQGVDLNRIKRELRSSLQRLLVP
jgi:AcrR family transcriptional regulator